MRTTAVRCVGRGRACCTSTRAGAAGENQFRDSVDVDVAGRGPPGRSDSSIPVLGTERRRGRRRVLIVLGCCTSTLAAAVAGAPVRTDEPRPGFSCTQTNAMFACLSVTSQQYFSLRINQPPATGQRYFSLRRNQHQPSATSQTNRPEVVASRENRRLP
jgi:hypothetical protein